MKPLLDDIYFDPLYGLDPEQHPDFSLWYPMLKSFQQDDGTLVHEGIISDEGEDYQGDQVPYALLQKSLPYLRHWGKYNWEHHIAPRVPGAIPVGDVWEVNPIDPAEALRDFGVAITGQGTRTRGSVYPINEPESAPEDLKAARHMLLSGGRMGYSLDGGIMRRAGKVTAVLATQIAMTSQPINPATYCRLAKSVGEALDMLANPEEAPPGATGPRVVIMSPLRVAPAREETVTLSRTFFLGMVKAMEAGGGVDAEQFTGGRALGRESLSPVVHTPLPGGGKDWEYNPDCPCKKCMAHQRKLDRGAAVMATMAKKMGEPSAEA